ncbi:MAG TPA: aldo/keto reductase [Sedimentisphaerales bacterium]|nr:aldo/keto reductase [Sedimentisphaerales bacterium]
MQKVRLGRTGLHVTKIGFGGIPIQRLEDDREAAALVSAAVEMGINWFDTATGYSTSEARIGEGIKPFRRESLYIFTKSPAKTPETLKAHIELSMTRLQTDYIDVFQFHGIKQDAWKQILTNGSMDMLMEMRNRGEIRHLAASSHSSMDMLEVLEHPAIEVAQFPFNFIMYEEVDEILGKCRAKDAGFIAMKPFGGGVFPSAGPCIRFLMQYPDVVANPGFENAGQIREVIALVEKGSVLSDEDRRMIEAVRKEVGSRFCRRCGYCLPCPHGVQILNLMIIESVIRRMPPAQVINGARKRDVLDVEKCIECGLCQTKCPFELPIMKSIREAAAMYLDYEKQHEQR